MSDSGDRTSSWQHTERDRTQAAEAAEILQKVYAALKEKGYNPIAQIAGYLMSGDPAYITRHQGARNLLRRLDRNELLEEMIRAYLES